MNTTKERVIVSLTTWERRITNLPTVLDSIFSQSVVPDRVVLNLSYLLVLPDEIAEYLSSHNVEINRVDDTKVYKKIIPTLKKYPDDCIISIDDDWIYPPGMIEEFLALHKKYPQNPISGNKELYLGFPVHCGCASLTKAAFFDNINLIDDDVIAHCKSDDIVYTYFSIKSRHPYIWTENNYFTNMIPFCPNDAYTNQIKTCTNLELSTLEYLISRFGNLPDLFDSYSLDPILTPIFRKSFDQTISRNYVDGENSIRDTYSYKLGHFILSPIYKLFSLLKNS